MKKTFLFVAVAALALACQSQAAIRWSLKYTTSAHHKVNAIITTGDYDATIGGYQGLDPFFVNSPIGGFPMLGISGERDGVPIAGVQHGYPLPLPFYGPYDPTAQFPTDWPMWIVGDAYAAPNFGFDNIVTGRKTGFDYFGLCFNAGGVVYNVYSDGVSVWELYLDNLVATQDVGDVITHFEIRQLPKECDDDGCGHK